VLDIGGGTGRNALALARRGHPVDVVESTSKFADMIRADANVKRWTSA
jgi:tRNA1(Val) A37 N6-methylase TrmN6